MNRRSFTKGVVVPLSIPLAFGRTALAQGSTPVASPEAGECVPIEDGDACLPIAPERNRVDLATPLFSNPTMITNPHFPISEITQAIQLGEEAGEVLRVEVTLLPDTKPVDWNDTSVETVTSQFVAYADGRIVEVATDFFAQADDGSVWYFGEDVFNYEGGVVANTDGTWLAGKDGSPGMIMPTDPQAGNVFRPENIPGLVFEEVRVLDVGVTVDGPLGPVEGAIQTEGLLMDGTIEHKVFAPGYGEFHAEAEDEVVTLAVAVQLNTGPASLTADLETLGSTAAAIGDTIARGDWQPGSTSLATFNTIWKTAQATPLPPLLDAQVGVAQAALARGIDGQDADSSRQAALDVERSILDLQLLTTPVTDVDLARMDLWARQLVFDIGQEDTEGVHGGVAVLEAIWARVEPTVEEGMAQQVATDLADLRDAIEGDDPASIEGLVEQLRLDLDSARSISSGTVQ